MVLVACTLATASCSSSGNEPPGVTPAATTAATAEAAVVTAAPVTTASPAAPGTSAPVRTTTAPTASGTTGSPGTLDAGAVDAITAAFEAFFGGATTTVDEKVALLQDGERYRGMLTDASADAQFQQMTTDVRDVRPGTDDECAAAGAPNGCAVVTHDILIGTMPMVAALESVAVPAGGTWLVAGEAWCSLVEIGGEVCPPPSEG